MFARPPKPEPHTIATLGFCKETGKFFLRNESASWTRSDEHKSPYGRAIFGQIIHCKSYLGAGYGIEKWVTSAKKWWCTNHAVTVVTEYGVCLIFLLPLHHFLLPSSHPCTIIFFTLYPSNGIYCLRHHQVQVPVLGASSTLVVRY